MSTEQFIALQQRSLLADAALPVVTFTQSGRCKTPARPFTWSTCRRERRRRRERALVRGNKLQGDTFFNGVPVVILSGGSFEG